jgi:hypothetical protein
MTQREKKPDIGVGIAYIFGTMRSVIPFWSMAVSYDLKTNVTYAFIWLSDSNMRLLDDLFNYLKKSAAIYE